MISEHRTATIIIPPPPSRAPPRPPFHTEQDRRENTHELNFRTRCDRKSLTNISPPPMNVVLSEHDSEFPEETDSDEDLIQACISGPSRAWTAWASHVTWNERLRSPEMFRRRLSSASEASSEDNSISPLTSKSSSILPAIYEDNSSLTSFSENDTDDKKMCPRPSRHWSLPYQSGSLLAPVTNNGSSSSDIVSDDGDRWKRVAPAIHQVTLSLVLNRIARRKRLYDQAAVSFSAYRMTASVRREKLRREWRCMDTD